MSDYGTFCARSRERLLRVCAGGAERCRGVSVDLHIAKIFVGDGRPAHHVPLERTLEARIFSKPIQLRGAVVHEEDADRKSVRVASAALPEFRQGGVVDGRVDIDVLRTLVEHEGQDEQANQGQHPENRVGVRVLEGVGHDDLRSAGTKPLG